MNYRLVKQMGLIFMMKISLTAAVIWPFQHVKNAILAAYKQHAKLSA